MPSNFYLVLILCLSHITNVSCFGSDPATRKSSLLGKLASTGQRDDCPGRSPLRHLCLPCKAIVHFWQSTMENEVVVRKVCCNPAQLSCNSLPKRDCKTLFGYIYQNNVVASQARVPESEATFMKNYVHREKSMIQTCSIVLHPHSFLCKAALEVFFLFMKHTSDERICQHLLICELNAHPQTMSSQVLSAHENNVLQILRDQFVGNCNSTTGLRTEEKNDLIKRVADELFTATRTSHLEDIDKTNLLSFLHRFLDAVDYHFSVKQF